MAEPIGAGIENAIVNSAKKIQEALSSQVKELVKQFQGLVKEIDTRELKAKMGEAIVSPVNDAATALNGLTLSPQIENATANTRTAAPGRRKGMGGVGPQQHANLHLGNTLRLLVRRDIVLDNVPPPTHTPSPSAGDWDGHLPVDPSHEVQAFPEIDSFCFC